ncbi:MAG: alpha/beta hydrolase family protein [Myxococcales bacterium]
MKKRPPLQPLESEDEPSLELCEMPPELALGVDPRKHEGRLRPELTRVAGKPVEALIAAVLCGDREAALSRACAELAVTGHGAYQDFVRADPVDAPERLPKQVADLAVARGARRSEALPAAIRHVEAARRTSRWLRAKTHAERTGALAALHGNVVEPRRWVAVCGEVDPPDRPVNVPATRFNQEDLWVPHRAFPKGIRVRVAYSDSALDPKAPVLLFLHGLGSRLEEADLTGAALVERGYGIVAFDLPNQGYSARFAFEEAGLPDLARALTRGANHVPALDFYTRLVREVVAAFDARFPGVARRLQAVCGGSQGGCLTLRLALDAPQLAPRFVPWSPAGVWDSFWNGAVHRFILRLGPLREALTSEARDPNRRVRWLRMIFDAPMGGAVGWALRLPTMPEAWWGPSWPGRQRALRAARLLRWELYGEWYRRWCSAMAHDQLAHSFRGPGGAAAWPIDGATGRLLLLTGEEDDMMFAGIHSAAESLAARAAARGAPAGVKVSFPATGHSLHDERPRQLAAEIDAFLREPG